MITPAIEAALQFCNGYEDHKDNLLWFLTNMINKSSITPLNLGSKSAKFDKSTGVGYATFGVYLAPSNEAGVNVCPHASKGCRASCLGHASGLMRMDTHKIRRIKRALWFHLYREHFMTQLGRELQAFIMETKAKSIRNPDEPLIPTVRLNGSSEIYWEQIPYSDETGDYPNIMARFPDVEFYDYTKAPRDKRPNIPDNYSLTFSIDERKGSIRRGIQWLQDGGNVSLVVRNRRKLEEYLTTGIGGFPCLDGDKHDVRHLDPPGHIVLLEAKGGAKKDTTGFVYDNLPF